MAEELSNGSNREELPRTDLAGAGPEPSGDPSPSEPPIMEVHHHAHTTRNNFGHYAFEFFMLFLAVFCGFLAEYYLEYKIERHREKQYIVSISRDLRTDSINIASNLLANHRLVNHYDTLLKLLKKRDYPGRANELYVQFYQTTYYHSFTPVDRTVQQLKNAGGMRLIENSDASDSITAYYEYAKGVSEQFAVFHKYFDEFHRDAFNVFDYSQFDSTYQTDQRRLLTISPINLVSNDPVLLTTLWSKLFVLKTIVLSHEEGITELQRRGKGCRAYLRTHYRVEL